MNRRPHIKGPVLFDKSNQELQLNLPPHAQKYGQELISNLMEEYAFESISTSVLLRINEYAVTWLSAHGIEEEWEFQE